MPDTEKMELLLDNAREALEVSGAGLGLLDRLQSGLGVSITVRDHVVQLEGDRDDVARAARFFEGLRRARNKGHDLHRHEFSYALQAFKNDREKELMLLNECRIDTGADRPPVFPRTFGQYRYVEAIRARDIAFGVGPAGTGKTYLAMALAVEALRAERISRIILTRPAIEAGETLGFLPGDMQAKVMPYLRPLYDALYDLMPAADIERSMDRGVIEVAPLAYMRGRTLNHAFVILDEAQNTTEEQMLMFLTRLGFDSKCVVTGDLTQVDLPTEKSSGLVEARETLRTVDGIAFAELDESDVVRHELVQDIIRAYRTGRGDRKT